MMADQEKDVLARALRLLALILNFWPPRRETPVITGRMIVAVAVTVEMGSAKARILYMTMLQRYLINLTVDGFGMGNGILNLPASDDESQQDLS